MIATLSPRAMRKSTSVSTSTVAGGRPDRGTGASRDRRQQCAARVAVPNRCDPRECDVRDAHSRLSAALDRTVGPETEPPPGDSGGRPRRVSMEGDVDVPEFLPPS